MKRERAAGLDDPPPVSERCLARDARDRQLAGVALSSLYRTRASLATAVSPY